MAKKDYSNSEVQEQTEQGMQGYGETVGADVMNQPNEDFGSVPDLEAQAAENHFANWENEGAPATNEFNAEAQTEQSENFDEYDTEIVRLGGQRYYRRTAEGMPTRWFRASGDNETEVNDLDRVRRLEARYANRQTQENYQGATTLGNEG